jgi:hypothetical protein
MEGGGSCTQKEAKQWRIWKPYSWSLSGLKFFNSSVITKFQIIPIPVRINNLKQPTTVQVYGMEVKTQDIKDMTSILKENTKPGTFIPFQMKYINQEAYNKALSHIAFNQDNTWVIKIKYMSDTAFFQVRKHDQRQPPN